MSFQPTHYGPDQPLATWDAPDAARPPGPPLPNRLPVRVLQWWGQWAQVECSNGWTAWVDGRWLQPLSATPAPAQWQPGVAQPAGRAQAAGFVWSIPLGGAALALLGAFLPWITNGSSSNSFDANIVFLFDYTPSSEGTVKVGWLLALLALGAGVLSALAVSRPGRLACGWGLTGVSALFVVQLQRLLSEFDAGSLFGHLGVGAYLTLAGGVVIGLGKVPGEGR